MRAKVVTRPVLKLRKLLTAFTESLETCPLLTHFETQDASDSPLLAAIREGHRELATLEPYLSAIVRLNDPWDLQGAHLVETGRLVVRPPNCALRHQSRGVWL